MRAAETEHKDLASWWQSFYDDSPFDLLLAAEDRDLAEPIKFLKDKLHLSDNSKVFDQCCGMGTLSLPMAAQGMNIVGADLCAKFIAAASAEAEAKKLSCTYKQADAFEFATSNCDGAFNWWTSFGYAAEDAQNQQMIARAFESLKSGGWFALDFPNMSHTIYKFDQYRDRLTNFVKDGQPIVLRRQSELDLSGGYLKQIWTFTFADQTSIQRNSSVRLYLPYALVNMFKSCGFHNITTYGSVQSEPLTINHDRCIVVGQKS